MKFKVWMKKNSVVAKTFAVLIAVGMWFYVLSIDNPERTVDKRDISVTLIGVDTLTQQKLAIADKKTPDINLRISGSISRLGDVTNDDIVVRSDVSKITRPGTYQLAYDVSIMDGITIVSRSPEKISVTVESIITKELPVKVNIVGELSENLETDKAIVDPLTVTVEGIESEVNKAAYAVVNIDAAKITDTYKGNVEYMIVDSNDKELKSTSITKIDETIDLEIPVYLIKSIPFAVDFIDGDMVTGSDANAVITPSAITVIGEKSQVERMKYIILGTVDLNSFLQNYTTVMDVTLPEGLTAKDDISHASVSVTLPDITTALFSVDNITLENVHEDYDAIVETISVVVTVRGKAESVHKLFPGDISLVVDMNNTVPRSGRNLYTAEVKFGRDITDVGVYGTYKVIVNSTYKPVSVEPGELPVSTDPSTQETGKTTPSTTDVPST